MIRSLTIAMALLLAPAPLLAQEEREGQEASRREANPLSVNFGVGFLASVNSSGGNSQFLMQFDALYHLTENVGIGAMLQAGPSSRSSTVAMTFESRFYVPMGSLRDDEDGIVGRLAPYVGAGIGFRTYTEDLPFDPGTTDFLFSPILGLEYDVSDQLSLTTDMRFNVTSGRDHFYYSWQMLGARFRF